MRSLANLFCLAFQGDRWAAAEDPFYILPDAVLVPILARRGLLHAINIRSWCVCVIAKSVAFSGVNRQPVG